MATITAKDEDIRWSRRQTLLPLAFVAGKGNAAAAAAAAL